MKYNKITDYTLLSDVNKETEQDIIDLCAKAIELGVKSVCVYPKWVKLASEQLQDSDVLVCTVISFPKGNDTTMDKIIETGLAIEHGADEIDMVADYQKVIDNWTTNEKDFYLEQVFDDVLQISNFVHSKGKVLKVIIESGCLSNEQTEWFTEVCIDANVDYIKTSTGKVSVGAEIEKVLIMDAVIDGYPDEDEITDLKIKVSGGIRTLEDQEMYYDVIGENGRFGMGFGSVDKINGIEQEVESDY